jgi:hypothetical protein
MDERNITETFIKLSHIRNELGIGTQDIAEYIGIDHNELEDLERGLKQTRRMNKYAAIIEHYTTYLNRYLQHRKELKASKL